MKQLSANCIVMFIKAQHCTRHLVCWSVINNAPPHHNDSLLSQLLESPSRCCEGEIYMREQLYKFSVNWSGLWLRLGHYSESQSSSASPSLEVSHTELLQVLHLRVRTTWPCGPCYCWSCQVSTQCRVRSVKLIAVGTVPCYRLPVAKLISVPALLAGH